MLQLMPRMLLLVCRCVRTLMRDVLVPLAFKLPDCGGHIRTNTPVSLKCEALMAGVRGKWDHNFDLSFTGARLCGHLFFLFRFRLK